MVVDILNVKILTPIQVIFDGQALSVSSVNSTGKFDILPFHANFITLVQKNPVILRIKKEGSVAQVKYDFDTAIIYTKDNMVKIYTNIQPQF